MKSCGTLLTLLLSSITNISWCLEEEELEQYTPDNADWTTLNEKSVLNNSKNTDHSPDGISWISRDDWKPWDGTTIYDPTEYTKKGFADEICPGNTVRGLYELFYDHKPFADIVNPTKAEVDNWHMIAVNHVRAMVGYTDEEYKIKPDKCLHVRALWSDERKYTTMWDAKYPTGTCAESTAPHCGAGFIPDKEDQQEYLPEGIEYCGKTAGSEGMFSAAKSNIPWSIRWARPFCSTLAAEGFWGGHTGPWFHRSKFGWSWRDSQPNNSNSNAGLRTKWSGPSGEQLYENPDITDGTFLVKVEGVDPNPRFPGFECTGINWTGGADNATACYERMMEDDNCGKRFMTFNSINKGCACYPVDVSVCEIGKVSGRLTWDFAPREYTFDGLIIDTENPILEGRRCPQINWLKDVGAGDPAHCLQKIIEGDYKECGRKFLTWNGGCACYPPDQKTCTKGESVRESGRLTFELTEDPSYEPPTQAPNTFSGTCRSVGTFPYLKKQFCKGRANNLEMKFARLWKIKPGGKNVVLKTVCETDECQKSDCCVMGPPRKCINTGDTGAIKGGFTQAMCGKGWKLFAPGRRKKEPCTGKGGLRCLKKNCCKRKAKK